MLFNHTPSFFSSDTLHRNNEEIKNNYERVSKELRARTQLDKTQGGLGKKELLDIYIKGFLGEKNYPGTQQGTQSLFETFLGKENNIRSSGSHDEHLIASLIQAIARAISIGNMSHDALIANSDSSSTHHLQI